ncbi:Protein-lysine N-methyltransferase efm5 [Friedmanniomyces endolithicus]|nr:Protein-lysine N-methyltransferase efm5 [Friedmanniomyces endolithicus]
MDALDDGDDVPQLPADTLRLLDEFATEKNTAAQKFKDLKLQSEGDFAGRLSMEGFSEDGGQVLGKTFVYYDLDHPLQLPAELKNKFDRIICDPPFLSDDCQTKTALTVRYLSKSWAADNGTSDGLRFISCTGERVGEIIARLYGKTGVKTTTFEPAHSKGLSNEFRCYANFECSAWTWRGA